MDFKKILILTIIITLFAGCIEKDTDGDGFADEIDDFPYDSGYHIDTDRDGFADEIDDFPQDSVYHIDTDKDGLADEVDDDLDGDGVSNREDDLPQDSRYHLDADKDGWADEVDELPNDVNSHTVEGAVQNLLAKANIQASVSASNLYGEKYIDIVINADSGSLSAAETIASGVGSQSFMKENGYSLVDVAIYEYTSNGIPYWVYSTEYNIKTGKCQYSEEGPN